MIEMQDIRTGKIVTLPTREERAAALLEKLEREREERDKLKPMIGPREIFFKKSLTWTLLGSCITAVLFLMEVVLSVALSIGQNPYIMIPTGIVMVVCIVAFAVLSIAKCLWERRLNKVGLHTPLEFQQKNTPD